MIESEEIVKIAKYFTVIAHTPGRLRIRVNPSITKQSGNITLEDIENLPKKINGIKSITIKKIIASVTISYDPKIFPFQTWEDLIHGKNLDEITELINKLAKEVV